MYRTNSALVKIQWIFGIFNFLGTIYCYNIDVDHPIIVENPDASQNKSYFGYSLALLGIGGKKWIKIGAPRASYNVSGLLPGVVYHCPLLGECLIDQQYSSSGAEMNNSRTGAAMDISYDHNILAVSASGQQKFLKEHVFIPGSLFIEHFKKKQFQNHFTPLRKPQVMDTGYGYSIAYYAYALAGFSLHFPKGRNELLVGAPGVYNYMGIVFRIKNIDKPNKTDWSFDIINPGGNYFEYSGYAVTSGYFYKKDVLHYVTSMPRSFDQEKKNVLFGAVTIFTFSKNKLKFENQVSAVNKPLIFGTQTGEYFGASLAAGDFNNDGLDDLIVGAPYRKNDKTGFNHGSVYVFYGQAKRLEYKPEYRIDGSITSGQFGSSLIVLGDLNNDGKAELAISAPYEEGSGAVYIYTFDGEMKTMKVTQKILGKNLFPNLKGFGMSFSRAFDIDGNNFADFAIGSPLSGHAVILRTKPTVSVTPRIEGLSSLSTSQNNFTFRCCYFYSDYQNENLTIIRQLTVDKNFKRFNFSNPEEKLIDIMRKEQYCETININKVQGVKNYNDSIRIDLSINLPKDSSLNNTTPIVMGRNKTSNDTFCKHCPVLTLTQKKSVSSSVIWDHKCYHNRRKEDCKALLQVSAKFLNLRHLNTLVLDSKSFLDLEVTVVNRGDPAFLPVLNISLPTGVSLRTDSVDCHVSETNNIICDGEEILRNEATKQYKLTLYVNPPVETNELSFFLNTTTATESRAQTDFWAQTDLEDRPCPFGDGECQPATESIQVGNTLNLLLKLKREADFLITGYSNDSSYVYEKDKTTLIQNAFKVEKFGPSSVAPVIIIIRIPHEIKSRNGTYIPFSDVIIQNETSVDNVFIKCDKINSSFEEKIIQDQPSTSDLSTLFYVNCSMPNIRCLPLHCLVGPFDYGVQSPVELLVDIEVDFRKLDNTMEKDWFTSIDQIVLTSEARVYAENVTKSGNRSDFTELTNVLLVDKHWIISLWLWIGSAVAGLVILVCVSVGLAKAGFFERKQHTMLLQLKEEALEEEKLIEEMIKQEHEIGDPMEGDLVFRYLKPEDLEFYSMGKKAFHSDEMPENDEELTEENQLYQSFQPEHLD